MTDAISDENTIIRDANTAPIIKNTTIATLNIFRASLNLPLARHFDTIIERASGKPEVEIIYKNAYISYAEL